MSEPQPFVMPILGSRPRETVTFIPTEEDRRWSERNHSQTLERIKDRGGFVWCELAAVLEHREWHPMDEDAAKAAVRARTGDTQ